MKTSKERPTVLLLDVRGSNLSIAALDCIKDDGETVLSFRLKLQPLDRSVYRSFKTYVYRTCDAWITNRPGQRTAILDLPGFINAALKLAATPANIKAGLLFIDFFPTPESFPLIRIFCHPT